MFFQVTTISEGGYFGELALVTHKARAATVSANAEDVRVACEYHKYLGYKYLYRNIAFT